MGRTSLALLCLWSCIVMVSPLTDTGVNKAMKYIRKTFNLAGEKQHAFAAVFSQKECRILSSNDNDFKILPHEKPGDIAKALTGDKNIYKGEQMVLATFRGKGNSAIHSEYRLLNPPSGSPASPVQELLKRNPEAACVLFYTLNSPCAGRCANAENSKNIIGKLSVFKDFNNDNKAFVYDQLYEKEKTTTDDIWTGLTSINKNMDVYRCSTTKCYKCFEKKNNKLTNKDNCLKGKL